MNYEKYKQLNEGEQSLVDWQYSRCGGFFTALWNAISRADDQNLNRLSEAFPKHIEAYENYTSGAGWWQTLKEELEITDGTP